MITSNYNFTAMTGIACAVMALKNLKTVKTEKKNYFPLNRKQFFTFVRMADSDSRQSIRLARNQAA
jgi:hypothetical protein